MKFLFPFDKVPKDSRIVLYGAGECGRDYYLELKETNWCSIVLWVDRNAEKIGSVLEYVKISLPEDIFAHIECVDYVVIAIDSNIIANEIRNFLMDGNVPENRIIHSVYEPYIIRSRQHDFPRDRAQKTKPHYFLSLEENKTENVISNRLDVGVKIRFVLYGKADVLVFYTVIAAFAKDSRYDVKVLAFKDDGLVQYLDQLNISYTFFEHYRPDEDKPNILFATSAGSENTRQLYQYVDHIIGVSVEAVKGDGFISSSEYKAVVKRFLWPFFEPEYWILDKVLYEEYRQQGILQKNMVLIGNPKYDFIHDAISKEKVYPSGWEKLIGKRVILWATDHGFSSSNVTIDVYGKQIFSYFRKHSDLGLIFRPHPAYFGELLSAKVWNESDLKVLRNYIDDSPNIIYDESGSYENAYRICDAILTDAGCGIIISGLPLNVPIGAMLRPEVSKATQENIISRLYRIDSEVKLEGFLDMVRQGLDTQKERHQLLMSECINHFDGKNGERIKKFVEDNCLNKN